MGLKIVAYSHLERASSTDPFPCENEEHIQACAYEPFIASTRGYPIITRAKVGYEIEFLVGPCYKETDRTERHSFIAGSYSGYSRWRESISYAYNPRVDPSHPFFELIKFADNEGEIGPDAARDLLADFQQHSPPQDVPRSEQLWFDWTRAFELASHDGLVVFT